MYVGSVSRINSYIVGCKCNILQALSRRNLMN
nr:MAG TPA: hypothetical protein [Bacteriophage sp.]